MIVNKTILEGVCRICSLPRSGTRYVTNILKNCGLPAEHEVLTQPNTKILVGWTVLDLFPNVEFTKNIHLVRDTRRCISSLVRSDFARRSNMVSITPSSVVDINDVVERNAMLWYEYNKRVEALNPILRIRLEDISGQWDELQEVLSFKAPFPGNVSTSLGDVKPRQLGPEVFKKLKCYDKIAQLSAKYGCEL